MYDRGRGSLNVHLKNFFFKNTTKEIKKPNDHKKRMNEHAQEEENTKKLFHFSYYLKELPNLLVLYVYFHNTQNLSTFFTYICATTRIRRHCRRGKGFNAKRDIVYLKEHMKCFSIM